MKPLIASIFFFLLFSCSLAADTDPSEKARYDILRSEIEKHNDLYYQKNDPLISDAAYDALMEELKRLEARHPDWISTNSPTQTLGIDLHANRPQAAHLSPMLSIDKAKRKEELYKFFQSLAEHRKDLTVNVEEKIDGIALSLQYQNGILVRALTRGDGRSGNDVTKFMKPIATVPSRLKENVPNVLEVRGEVFMTKTAFHLLNQKRKNKYTNARNASGGLLNSKRPNPSDLVSLSFIPHGIGFSSEVFVSTQAELLQKFNEFGFPLKLRAKKCSSIKEIKAAVSELERSKERLDYEMDGVVVKVNELELERSLGATAKHWRGMVAYKFAASCAWTVVKEIRLQTGKKGSVTPVAVLEPIILEGSKIQRVSLHNLNYVKQKDIRVGDSLLIEKKARVIPQVISILPGERSGEQVHMEQAENQHFL